MGTLEFIVAVVVLGGARRWKRIAKVWGWRRDYDLAHARALKGLRRSGEDAKAAAEHLAGSPDRPDAGQQGGVA